jgi:hypothetical protein
VPYSELALVKLAEQVLSVPPVAVEPMELVVQALPASPLAVALVGLSLAVEQATEIGQCRQAG